jgi:hypothetical protein
VIKLLSQLPIPREDYSDDSVEAALNHLASLYGKQFLTPAADCVVDPGRRLVTVRFGKRLTFEDIGLYAKSLLANPLFQPDYAEIVDLTGVEELDLQAEEFLKLADQIDPFSPEAKRAFVVRTSTQNHAARMHKVLRTQTNIDIFHSVEEAERWVAL